MLKTIVLICAASLDHSACTIDNAIDKMSFPPTAGMMCPFAGMATLAGTELKPGPGEYMKIICERSGKPG